MGVLKSIYGCQTIHHFPSQSSAENSHPTLTVLLGRFYKSSEVNPRTGNLSLTLGFLWDAPVKCKQIAKGSKILSQLGYLCVLPALTKISLHPSILLVSLMSGVPEQKEIWLLLFLEFRAWSASKDPSAVFQINASWWGWPEFTFLSSAPPAWVRTPEEEQGCPKASWTTIAEFPAAPLLEPPAVGAEAGKGI